MQTSGDVVDLDLGQPEGRAAGFLHRAIVIRDTAEVVLIPGGLEGLAKPEG